MVLYLSVFLAGWKGTGPCVEIVLCLSGEKNTAQQRMSVKCVVLVQCARNRHDGWLITGCGSDDATPRARLCCLCLMQALIATPDLIRAFFYFFFFLNGDGHHVLCVQSGNSLVTVHSSYPLWLRTVTSPWSLT